MATRTIPRTATRTITRTVPTAMIIRAWRMPPGGPIGLIIPIVHLIGLIIHRIEPQFTLIIRSTLRRYASR